MTLRFRPFTEEDRPPCQAIASSAAMSSYGPHLPHARHFFQPDAPLEDVELRLVACLGGTIVGFVDLNGRHISNLFVDPRHQGRGHGTALLRHVEARFGRPLTLACFKVNEGARRLYERYGFTVESEREIMFAGRPVLVWNMVLDGPSNGDRA
ncbi:GNAT family N-acetyltransferase [Chelativorans intermedius]|uniref:GNAT family N-acetyltransferase n=1 Tax=Chelativorans intermedius TaxID=515947 RepID=A0ABV6D4J0_9HYPH|nr:GNAT family N-acetyltransferase [Chelativorans intermedius]MCT8997544.1 GNAT family N-acetyltransferase [Chelativorans intermedius]